jgi:hypothetical protein
MSRHTSIFLFILSFSYFAQASDCRFELNPIVIEESSDHLLQYWDFNNSTVNVSIEIPDSINFGNYRKIVSNKMNVSPLNLLKRYSRTNPNSNDNFNLQVVINSPGYIRPVHCIEALLLDYQIQRNTNMLTAPTEFFSVYLTNDLGKFRVYYLTDDMNGLKKLGPLFENLEKDLANGWSLVGNLHNHSFWLNNVVDDKSHPQGVLSPSATDIQLFESMKSDFNLPSASITNGFNTVEVPSSNFTKFRSPLN